MLNKIVLLQEAIAAGPFVLLAFGLIAVGVIGLIYFLLKLYKLGNKRSENVEERTDRVIQKSTFIILSIIIFILLVVFTVWLRNIRFD